MSVGEIRAGRAFVEIGGDVTPLKRIVAAAQGILSSFAASAGSSPASFSGVGLFSGVTGLAASLRTFSGVGLFSGVTGLAASLRTFSGFEDALARLRATASPTAGELRKIESAATGMSRALSTGQSDVIDAMTELLRAGLPMSTVLKDATQAAVQFAKVGGISMAEAAVTLSDAVHVFSREGITAAAAADILSRAADASSTDIQGMSQGFAQASSVFAQSGQSLEDLAAAMGILANAGIKGEEAGTALKTMLLRLLAPADEGLKIFKQYGLQVRDANNHMLAFPDLLAELRGKLGNLNDAARDNALRDLFGDRAIRSGIVFLKTGADGFQEFKQGMSGALDVAQKFAVVNDTLSGTMSRLFGRLGELGTAVGSIVSPSFRTIVDLLSRAAATATDLIRPFAGIIGPALAAAAAAKGFSLAISGLGAIPALLSNINQGLAPLVFRLANGMIPIAGMVPAIAAAGVGVAAWIVQAAQYTAKLSDEFQKAREEADKLAESSSRGIERLKTLVTAGPGGAGFLTGAQAKEARVILAELTKQYGDFGVTIDPVTGQLDVAAGAFENLSAKMKENSLGRVTHEIQELRANIDELNKSINSALVNTPDASFGESGRISAIREQVQRRDEEFRKLEAATKRLRELRGGNGPESVEAARAASDREQDLAYALHQLQIELIDDEKARRIAAIQAEYDEKIRKLEGPTEGDVALINQARAAALARVEQDFARKAADDKANLDYQLLTIKLQGLGDEHKRTIALIDARADHEIAAARRVGEEWKVALIERQRAAEKENEAALQRHETARRIAEQTAELDELKLRAQYRGTELEEKLLELHRRQAVEKAIAGGATASEVALILQKYDLLQKIAEQERVRHDALTSALGTFSTVGAAQLGGTGLARIAEDSLNEQRRSNELLNQIARALGNGFVYEQ